MCTFTNFPVQWSLHPLSHVPVDLLQGVWFLHTPWHLTHFPSKTYVPSLHTIKTFFVNYWNVRVKEKENNIELMYLALDFYYLFFVYVSFTSIALFADPTVLAPTITSTCHCWAWDAVFAMSTCFRTIRTVFIGLTFY